MNTYCFTKAYNVCIHLSLLYVSVFVTVMYGCASTGISGNGVSVCIRVYVQVRETVGEDALCILTISIVIIKNPIVVFVKCLLNCSIMFNYSVNIF
jgi:hypothetical protein